MIRDLVKEKYIQDSLLELSELGVSEIEEQLNKIANYTKDDEKPIYPFYETVKDKEGKMVVQVKEKDSKDFVEVANVIVARMRSFQQKQIHEVFKNCENILEYCSYLRYLEYRLPNEEKDAFLNSFDEEFSYLENVPSFCSIYYKFREDYIKEFERVLYQKYARVRKQQEGMESALFFGAWRTDAGYGRAIRKHLEGKVRK